MADSLDKSEYVTCEHCGGALSEAVEITAARPWGTGYMIMACEVCGETTDDRRWVGR